MKIFAVRDRMLDYFQRPMAFERAADVLSALGTVVNNPDQVTNEIHQAPHHFELWELGEVDEEGKIRVTHTLVANCSSLVRDSFRETAKQNRTQTAGAAHSGPNGAGSYPASASDSNGAKTVQNAPQATRVAPTDPHQEPPGGH